ncbi:hypothetical protein WDW86_03490 [Bdellovibrionota bacterium FG-2]
MKRDESTPSDSLLAVKGKTGLWLIVVFVVTLLTTGLYVTINGYDKWKGDMKDAAVYLQAAGGVPAAAPQANTVDRVLQILQPVPVAKKTVVSKQAGQYVCPVCGATGLPDYAVNGDPVCQVCRHKMDVIYVK